MRKLSLLLMMGICIATGSAQALEPNFENRLGNANFEDILGTSANWNNDPGRGILRVKSTEAPSGDHFFRLDEQFSTSGVGTFTFQTVGNVKPGDIVAFRGLARESNLDDGDDDAEIRLEFQTRDGVLLQAVNTSITSTSFLTHTVQGIAPDGTAQVTFVIRIQNSETNGTGASTADFDAMVGTVNGFPVQINVGENQVARNPGEVVIINTRLNNVTAQSLTNVDLVINSAPNLSVHTESINFNGRIVDQREGSIILSLGDLGAGQNSFLSIPVFLHNGLIPGGRYEITFFARSNGTRTALSDLITVSIEVEQDPLFTLGTIIGKVFHDENENEIQDAGETGIPNVRLATEQGAVVYTDANGKYHIPGVTPGRHMVKIDHMSLPRGTQFVTEHAYLTKITEGILAKVNFAVKLPPSDIPAQFKSELDVQVVEELDTIDPVLELSMDPLIVRAAQGVLEKPVTFSMKTNYGPLVERWKIEVRDERGREVWSGYGPKAPPVKVVWEGKTNGDDLIAAGDYAVRMIVFDAEDREDWTPLTFFRVISKINTKLNRPENAQFSSIGFFSIDADGKRSIPVTNFNALRVQGTTPPVNDLFINGQEVTVNERGSFEKVLFVPTGEQIVDVVANRPDGESLTYRKHVDVRGNYLFFTGLTEGEMGSNTLKGNMESVRPEDRFRDGFYQDGRVAYYLKGKVQGKYLVSSSLDTERNQKPSKLFTNLDPDKYYPVYGDDSRVDYEAQDTQGKVFALVEWDRSFVKYGSFHTDLNETELASHNRTMSGAKAHFESLKSTDHGDSKYGFTAFYSKQEQVPDHNEFLGTGGSLYYLKHRPIVEGSDKLRVEIRDKYTGIVRESKTLQAGVDYEIDYSSGRVMLASPLLSVSSGGTIIQDKILDGNDNVLVADYEYRETDMRETPSTGLRGFTHFGQHVRVGGTYIDDKTPPNDNNYTLRGVDMTVKLGSHTRIDAEYAESENEDVEGFYSSNGGLSFAANGTSNLAGPDKKRNGAYVIKAQSRPFQNLDVSGYIQKYNPFFSNGGSVFSQGDRQKYGLESNYRITPQLNFKYRYDNVRLLKKELQPATQTSNEKFQTLQLDYDDDLIIASAEYRHSDVNVPDGDKKIDSIFSTNNFDDAFGGKLGYRLGKYTPYLRGQAVFNDGESNNQIGAGLEAKISDKASVTLESNIGNVGDSTTLRFATQDDKGQSSYADLSVGDGRDGNREMRTTVGSSYQLNDRSRIFTEKQFSEFGGDAQSRNIVGLEKTLIEDRLGARVTIERNELNRARAAGTTFGETPTLTNALSTAFDYKDGDFMKASTKWEYRGYSATDSRGRGWQWLGYHNLEVRFSEDFEVFGRFNISKTRDVNLNDTLANFVELNTGFSYRPVTMDRLNVIGRYTYLNENVPDDRFEGFLPTETSSQTWALELVYDLNSYFQVSEKFAYRLSDTHTNLGDSFALGNYLWVNRLNYHLTRQWDIVAEYRFATQQGAAENRKHGLLLEVDRDLFDYMRLGIGYSFVDFRDRLRSSLNYQSFGKGPYVRMTGKF